MIRIFLFTCFQLCGLTILQGQYFFNEVPVRPLFNGKNLKGWHQVGGKARYEVRDGIITGTTVAGTPNSFLVTNERYGDFILALEFRIDQRLNSGIQVRSNAYENYNKGQFHGYQVEIDPSDRGWSGGIYDEGRRGWLCHPDTNAPVSLYPEDWNSYRIEVIGNRIRTWVNGRKVSDLEDDMTRNGFIGLQVHSVTEDKAGLEVSWRNIRIQPLRMGGIYASVESPDTPLPALTDQDSSTVWAGKKGDWVAYDFRNKVFFTGIAAGFRQGAARHRLLVEYSLNGKQWKTYGSLESFNDTGWSWSGKKSPVRARFARVTCLGNAAGDETVLTELGFSIQPTSLF